MTQGNILITGASTGIGATTALLLARSGYRVFAGVRKAEDGELLLAESPGELVPLMLDVTQADSIRASVDEVTARVGDQGLRGLINNAGVYMNLPLETCSMDAFRQLFEVNVVGTMAVTQAFLPLVRKARGRIINIGSAAGRGAGPGLGVYASSKHALEALTVTLRTELNQFGIEVTMVAPGSIRTPIWDKAARATSQAIQNVSSEVWALYAPLVERMRRLNQNMARAGIDPEEVAKVVLLALTEKRPRTRYSVGFESHFVDALRFLPDRVRELLIRKQFGL